MDPHRGPNSRRSSAPSFAVPWTRLVPWIGLLILVAACGSPGGETRSAASATPASAATIYPSPVTDLAPVGATETARVVRVVDGDTIVIDRGRGNERVRYIGIDTPESVKPDTPVQFMANEASAANVALVAGRDVVLERGVSDTDQYDRLPALRLAARGRRLGVRQPGAGAPGLRAGRHVPAGRAAGRTRSWLPSGRRARPASGSGDR